ncbi:MAG: LysM peptidoglycan-binding domain-containing protein [Candidatus Eisenbacteria bacterium]
MKPRRVWLWMFSATILVICSCAPRYTTTPEQPPVEPVPDGRVEVLLDEAESAYQEGVDLFVREEFDSASAHLEYAITLLSRDVAWSSDGSALSERRILLYKCRYFLERVPVAVSDVIVEPEIDEIEPRKPPLPSVELLENDKVRGWIRYFTGDGKASFAKWLKRSGLYRPLMLRIFKEEGLPPRMVNLAMIESGYNPNAYSKAHAVGMWQFIKSTGRIYGLRVDWWVDERRDPVQSGRAAARHLRDLYQALDSWPLALAAYNSGQRCVERAIRRGHTRDYWRLRLPSETRDFVPKFMAACLIMENPQKYGFDSGVDGPVSFDEIEVGPKTDLKIIAEACQVPASVISELNPHLIRGCAPDGKSSYAVRIPGGKLELCRSNLASVPPDKLIAKVYASPEIGHTVKRGETLSRIANKYGTTIAAIGKANRLKSYHRIGVGQVLKIPGDGYVSYPDNPGVHSVRRGETLSSIAGRYGVQVRDLMEWNNLPSAHLIYSGQRLIVALDKLPENRQIVHRVKKGETVSTIARLYRASTQAVLLANELGSRDRIYPGQDIKVPVTDGWMPRGQQVVHVVRRGETVTSISKHYGVSIEHVLSANGLRSSDKIYPGQKIKIGGYDAPQAKPIVHSVARGETVSGIAERYGVPTQDILAANGLGSSDRIYPGQKLEVRRSNGGASQDRVEVHTVCRGETVSSIAKRYGTSVTEVLNANGLGSRDKIYPGQSLVIFEGKVPRDVLVYHEVTRGETISSIAGKYGATVNKVLEANEMKARDRIYPGQKIKVPVRR